MLKIGLAGKSHSSQVEVVVPNLLDFMTIDTRAPYVAVFVDDALVELTDSVKTNEILCLGRLHDVQMSNYIQ